MHFEGGDTDRPVCQQQHQFRPGDQLRRAGRLRLVWRPNDRGGLPAAAVIFHPTQEMGGELGYQHWWLDNLRSNINGGFNAHYSIPIKLVGVPLH